MLKTRDGCSLPNAKKLQQFPEHKGSTGPMRYRWPSSDFTKMWHHANMSRWSQILQFLAALLFLMQVPLHMKHSLIMEMDPGHLMTHTDHVASDPQTHPSGSGHEAHLHHQDPQASSHVSHQDTGNAPASQTSESMPAGKHQNHDCTCCMPMISEVPAAISLPVNLKGKHHLSWTLPNWHLLDLLRATARGPPAQQLS